MIDHRLRSIVHGLFLKHQKPVLYHFHVQTLLQRHASQHGGEDSMVDWQDIAQKQHCSGGRAWKYSQVQVRGEILVLHQLHVILFSKGAGLFKHGKEARYGS